MPTPFLAVNLADGTTPQVRRYVTGVASAQGVAFGSLETSGVVADQQGQRVCRFLGHSTWIVVAGTSIFRTTDAGATYSTVFGPDAELANQPSRSGPHLLYPNGVATLVVAAKLPGTTTSWKLYTSTDGVTWTKSGAFSLLDTGTLCLYAVTEWRGSIYAFTTGGGTTHTFIFNSSTMSVVTGLPAVGVQCLAMAVYNDRLFALGTAPSATSARSLFEFIGGTWQNVQDQFIVALLSPVTDQKFCLFTDPASNLLVGICTGVAGAAGWRAFTWDNSLVRTEITSAIAIQSVLGAASTTSRIAEMVDRQDNPATLHPSIYLYVAANGALGSPMSVYQWNGIASPITSIGAGGNVRHAIPFGVRNGGECFWTSGQRHIERISATPVIGGVRFGFKIYSPLPSVDAVSVRWLLAPAGDESPHTPYATLSNPSVGTLSAGNTQVDGLDAADNGATTFFVTWLAQTDGYSIGTFAKTTPQIFS